MVSVIKFSILIGSALPFLSRDHVGVQLQVFNYNFLLLDTCNWTPASSARQSRALKWVLSCCFPTVCKTD